MKRRAWLSLVWSLGVSACRKQGPDVTGAPVDKAWIPLVDAWEGVMGGEVSVTDEGWLRLNWSETLTGAKWTGAQPVPPFEIELEARRVDGTDFFCGLTFPARGGGECVTLVVGGWGGGLVGISSIDGRDASENETTLRRSFEAGRWYQIHLGCAGDRIRVRIDGETVIDADVSGKTLSLRPGPIAVCAPFGLATWQSTGELRNIRWRSCAG